MYYPSIFRTDNAWIAFSELDVGSVCSAMTKSAGHDGQHWRSLLLFDKLH